MHIVLFLGDSWIVTPYLQFIVKKSVCSPRQLQGQLSSSLSNLGSNMLRLNKTIQVLWTWEPPKHLFVGNEMNSLWHVYLCDFPEHNSLGITEAVTGIR